MDLTSARVVYITLYFFLYLFLLLLLHGSGGCGGGGGRRHSLVLREFHIFRQNGVIFIRHTGPLGQTKTVKNGSVRFSVWFRMAELFNAKRTYAHMQFYKTLPPKAR